MKRGMAVEFAKNILDLIEDKLYFTELDDLAKEHSGGRSSDKLRFMTRLYKLVNNLPLTLWKDEKHRETFLTEFIKYLESETVRDLGRAKFNKLSDNTVKDEGSIFDKK